MIHAPYGIYCPVCMKVHSGECPVPREIYRPKARPKVSLIERVGFEAQVRMLEEELAPIQNRPEADLTWVALIVSVISILLLAPAFLQFYW
jgi:hypothetical protein